MQAEGRAQVLARVLLGVTAGVIAGADQLTKALARASLGGESVVIVPGWLELALTRNSGGAFGIFPGGRFVFLTAVAILLVGVVVSLGRIEKPMTGITLGVLVGGAIGNAIDRLFMPGGLVTDFVDFRWWPAFNVADAAIVVGSAMVAFVIWRKPVTDDRSDDESDDESEGDQ